MAKTVHFSKIGERFQMQTPTKKLVTSLSYARKLYQHYIESKEWRATFDTIETMNVIAGYAEKA